MVQAKGQGIRYPHAIPSCPLTTTISPWKGALVFSSLAVGLTIAIAVALQDYPTSCTTNQASLWVCSGVLKIRSDLSCPKDAIPHPLLPANSRSHLCLTWGMVLRDPGLLSRPTTVYGSSDATTMYLRWR